MAIVIANMIGTGVFTSLGFQLSDITNTNTILMLWLIGGIIALAGAFSYAEIGTVIYKSGGEYTFLSKIYHPLIGYLAGWISLSVGFAAPIALAAIAISDYTGAIGWHIPYIEVAVIIIISLIHSFNLKLSSLFQNISTSIKILFIVCFIAAGLWISPANPNAISYISAMGSEVFSPAFAIALIFVTYSYTGWNAAAYITEEFESPRKDLPKALILGSFIVTLLYTILQYVFLKHAPYESLVGQVEIGAIVASYMLSPGWANIFSGMISLLLISSISAMVWVGPRVTEKMSEDYPLWSFLSVKHGSLPWKAIWFQAAISIALILTGTFEQILIYCGILLTLSSALVVLGVFYVRNDPTYTVQYRSPGYPIWQLLFLALSFWMIGFAIHSKPMETLFGLSNLGLGLFTYYLDKKLQPSS